MTHISYDRLREKHILVCSGHTEYSTGQDILCSAVSSLCYCAKAYFERACSEGKIRDLRADVFKGYYAITFECDESSPALEVLKAFLDGFELLAQEFPDHISVDA